MNGLTPIVEANSGKREFLLTSTNPYRAPYVASRTEPFPDAASLELVLKGTRWNEQWTEQYGIGRAANNLGAVYICNNHTQAALKVLHEAELKFLEMINERCPYPIELTFGGLAMVQYNAVVVYLSLGHVVKMLHELDPADPENQVKPYADAAERARASAVEALDEADELDRGLNMTGDDDRDFVRSALAALPVLT